MKSNYKYYNCSVAGPVSPPNGSTLENNGFRQDPGVWRDITQSQQVGTSIPSPRPLWDGSADSVFIFGWNTIWFSDWHNTKYIGDIFLLWPISDTLTIVGQEQAYCAKMLEIPADFVQFQLFLD